MVLSQVRILKTTTDHLKNAYNGKDIDWYDQGKLNLRKKKEIKDE